MNTDEFITFLATGIETAEVYQPNEDQNAVLIFFTLSDGREVYVEIK